MSKRVRVKERERAEREGGAVGRKCGMRGERRTYSGIAGEGGAGALPVTGAYQAVYFTKHCAHAQTGTDVTQRTAHAKATHNNNT